MLGRTKKHPNKTQDMGDAIQVFEKWLLDYKKFQTLDSDETEKINSLTLTSKFSKYANISTDSN